MSNDLSFRFVALLLLCVAAVKEPVVAADSPANPSASVTSQPLLDGDILSVLDQVDANRISADIQTLVAFGTRNTCSDNSGASPGIGAARDWILNRYLSLTGLQVTLVPWTYKGCSDGTTHTLHNVIAWIPGSGHPNRLIVIGGHYDSRTTDGKDGVSPAPGANDSGSQTALVLEAARVMAGHLFDATVVFADWSGEEQGLQGSSFFVQHYRDYFPSGTLELNLNSDIIGGDNTVNNATALQQFRLFSPGTPREVRSAPTGSTDDTSPSRGIMRHIGYWGGAYVPTMMMLPQLREDRPGRSSDHSPFISRSIPGVRFIDVNEKPSHQHSPNDLYIYVTPAFTARVSQVVVASAASLARAPTPPLNMIATGISSSTVQLTWSPPASGSPVDHYAISARTSAENFYRTRVVVPGDLTSATVDVFQDLGIPSATAYYVSVAAVDAGGHESLYAYPEYRCDSTNTCSQPDDALNVTAISTGTPTPTPTPANDLKVTVTDGKTTIVAGTQNTYTITVTNAGAVAVTGASVIDTFPSTFTGVTFTATQSGGATGFAASGTGNINDTVNMPSGSKITYTAKGKVGAGATGNLSNPAQVTTPDGVVDSNTSNNSATDSDTITYKADLKVTVTDGKTAAVPGSENTYTIVVRNMGPSDVTGAVVSETFPTSITGVTYTATQTGGASDFSASGSGDINDTVVMPSGGVITYKAKGTISASATGTLSNTATVSAPNGSTDPNLANNSATDSDTL
jgi:uncharacterized repeat protein (TIGR01451 family)